MTTQVAMFSHRSASLVLTVWDDERATITDLYSKRPRRGHASALLMKVTSLCDTLHLTILIEVLSGRPELMSDLELRAFYTKFGFEELVSNRNPIIMVRNPR